jgi:acetylglutamate kinase
MSSAKRFLVKIGGSTLGQEDTTLEDLAWLQGQGYQPIVVHGGGKTITQWLEKMAVPTKFVGGLRVTDEQSIDVVVAVLAGVVNKGLVASINAIGGRAMGLSGADGAMVKGRIKDPQLGLVGEVTRVDGGPVEATLAKGYMPVISPIGVLEKDGKATQTLLNINADTAAAAIGAALGVETCIFLTDVPGVKGADGNVMPRLSPSRVKELTASGVISGGMIPKVEAAMQALAFVKSSLILDGRTSHALRQSLAGAALGTRIE